MLKDDSEPRRALTSEELFARALPLLNIAVRQACRRCHHYPTPEDVNRFSQRLVVLLMEDNYCVLDSCKEQAKFPAWLQGLVNYQVQDFLRRERRKVSLDEVSLDRFTAQPSQETEVWEKEKTEILQRVKKRLTKWERQLLDWLLAGLAEEEIARKRGVRVETIYQAKNRLIKKLRWLIGELREKKMIFLSRFSVLEAL